MEVNKPKIICGLDESGRGALAGPLVAAAVILPKPLDKIKSLRNLKIEDSKLLNAKQRRTIHHLLLETKAEVLIESISHRQINNHGIGWANKVIFRKLIKRIEADEYIIDGNLKLGRIKGKTKKMKSVIDADATIPEAILAGIIAKVERDKIMKKLHQKFPQYLWNKNVGYGTKQHKDALIKYGFCFYHRLIFVTTALKTPNSR